MYNFYEIPAEIIDNIQQMISKNDVTLTTNFNQIVTKNNSNYLDGFALNTLYNNPIYNQFYNYLIEQLDFTKINKGKFKIGPKCFPFFRIEQTSLMLSELCGTEMSLF